MVSSASGVAMGCGIGSRARRNVLVGEAPRIGRRRRADEGRAPIAGLGGRDDRADGAEGVAEEPAGHDVRSGEEHVQRGRRIRGELADADRQRLGRVVAVAADVERQHVIAGRMEYLGVGQGPIAVRLPTVDQDDPGSRLAAAGRDEPGREAEAARWDDGRLEGQGPIGRRQDDRSAPGQAGSDAVDDREPIGEGGRDRHQRGGDAGPGESPSGRTEEGTSVGDATDRRLSSAGGLVVWCHADGSRRSELLRRPARLGSYADTRSASGARGRTRGEPGDREGRLAPSRPGDLTDVIGSDPATARAATRRMAAINTAYEALRDGPGTATQSPAEDDEGRSARRRGGPPPPRPTRPVTGRVDRPTRSGPEIARRRLRPAAPARRPAAAATVRLAP